MTRKDPDSTRLIERLIAAWAWFQSLLKAMKSVVLKTLNNCRLVHVGYAVVHLGLGLRHKIQPQRELDCFCV